jgi:CheY-like chemotaxis protein
MPEMNGVEYLQKHFQAGHPPVIMISSVAREDTDLAIRSMQFGATDYIEKPSLEGFDDKKDEICSKIRFAVNTPDARGLSEKALEIDHKFSKDFALKDLDKKVRVIIASPRENKKLEFLFKQLKGGQPPIVIVSYGPINLMEKTLSSLRSDLVLGLPGAGSMKVGGLYLTEFNKDFEGIRSTSSKMKACYMILGAPSVRDSKKIIGVPGAHFIFEDLKKVHKDHDNILNMASEVVPVTSFIYHADRYFLEGK